MVRKTFKQVLLSEDTYQKIRDQGKAGDSINDVVSRILLKNAASCDKVEVNTK